MYQGLNIHYYHNYSQTVFRAEGQVQGTYFYACTPLVARLLVAVIAIANKAQRERILCVKNDRVICCVEPIV